LLLEIDIRHDDPGYVESRGGYPLLSYLRSGSERASHRREAIDRALGLFADAEGEGRPEPEIGGLGLLVLQRALFAAEDLGGLVHAFAGPDPWQRLRTAKIPQLDEAFMRSVRDVDSVLAESFVLATEQQIDEDAPTDEQRAALRQLRVIHIQRWTRMLERCAQLWLDNRNAAKATMHGYPMIAGAHVFGPPSAGDLADGIRPPNQRFAMAVTSKVFAKDVARQDVMRGPDGEVIIQKEVVTDRTLVALGSEAVNTYARAGRLAAKLAAEVSELQARSIEARHGASVPLRGSRLLDEAARRAIAGLQP
jgi:hypothetical protein